MASGFEILLNGPAFNIWERCEVLLNAVLQSKFACMAAVSFPTNPASCSTGSKTSKPDHHSAHTVQLQTVRLTLKWGQIEEEKTSVIVNVADKDYWYHGQTSNAIFRKAGQRMTEEVKRTRANENIIVTGPYNLDCVAVYHTLWTNRSTEKAYESLQILSGVVSECLWLAARQPHQSVAFPAISARSLGLEREEVAHIMSEAVLKFAEHYSMQMEVYFVVSPGDQDTFQAFEEKMRSLEQKTFNPQPTNAVTEQRDDFSGSRASTAKISLSGPSEESIRAAHIWLSDFLLRPSTSRSVQNNFITHFGEEEYVQLKNIMCKNNISIEEILKQGQASIVLRGNSVGNVAVALLEVESILGKIQRDFVEEEVKMFSNLSMQYRRCEVPHSSTPDYLDLGLEVVKLESVENSTLRMLFEMKKNQMKCSTTRKMMQRIPAHFRDMVSYIGFQAEFAPPDEPAYGQGIYFTGTVSAAMDTWREAFSEYLYFVEAEVLTGNSVLGKPDLILPPPLGADPLVRYDSVSGGRDISVIFTGCQALPVHIITCKNKNTL